MIHHLHMPESESGVATVAIQFEKGKKKTAMRKLWTPDLIFRKKPFFLFLFCPLHCSVTGLVAVIQCLARKMYIGPLLL